MGFATIRFETLTDNQASCSCMSIVSIITVKTSFLCCVTIADLSSHFNKVIHFDEVNKLLEKLFEKTGLSKAKKK